MHYDVRMCWLTNHRKRGEVGTIFFLIREPKKGGYICCTPIKWCFVVFRSTCCVQVRVRVHVHGNFAKSVLF